MSRQKQDEQKKGDELEEFAPIKQIHLRGDGIKLPNIVGTIDLDDGEGVSVAHSGATRRLAKRIDWHPAGVRVWLEGGAVAVVPFDQIDAIVQVRFPKVGRR